MARLAGRRTRTPESDDEDESRAQTPLSTAPSDKKRARRHVDSSDEEVSEEDASHQEPAPTQTSVPEKKPNFLKGQIPTGHRPGAIVRVKLTNFVTYTAAEFRPGPSLNMVIGPNGTGKSTLVCAICLGLGWPTHHLGRAKDPAEFVKHGCREATIEIELQRKESGQGVTRKNPVITRTIIRDNNKSKFTLNGAHSTQKGIMALCKNTFNIQIDNLCQFLPQDRVVEFAQMNPIQVLESTQQAAGTPDMIHHHVNLIKLRTAQRSLMQEHRGQSEQLATLERRQEGQRTEVERMRERAVTKKKLEWLEQCLPVPTYGQAKQDMKDAKKLQQNLAADLDKLKADLGPTLRKVNAKQQYVNQREALAKDMGRAVTNAEKKVETKEKLVKDLRSRCDEYQANHEAEKKSVKAKQEDRLKIKHRISQLKRQHEEKPPEFDSRAMTQEIKDRRDEVRNLKAGKDEVQARLADLTEQGRSRNREVVQLHERRDNMQTQTGQQESKLRETSQDTYSAWRWIQENRDLFEKHVYGPPVVECSLKDASLAPQIESMMQPSDFKIITAQTHKDFVLLQEKLNRELGLSDISLRTCSETDLSRYRPPISKDELASYGLENYVIDHLNGPATVLAMLCNERFLHQAGFASQALDNHAHNRVRDSELKSYISGGTIQLFRRRAEYAGETITQSRSVGPAKHWSDQPVDIGRRAAIDRDIAEKVGELSLIKEEHEKCKIEISAFTEKMGILQEEIKTIAKDKEERQMQQAEWNKLPIKIAEQEKKLENIEEWLGSCRERLDEALKKRDKTMLEMAEAAVQFAATITEVRDARENLVTAEVLFIEATSDFENFRDQNMAVRNLLQQKQNEEKEARIIAERASNKAKQLIVVVRTLMGAAQKLADEGDPGFQDLLQTMGGSRGEERWSSERLDAEIDSHKALLALTEGGSMRAIKEFEDRSRAIERLRCSLAEFDQQQQDQANAIKEVRRHWEPQLETLVAKISEAFSDSFARIGLAGQVAVYKASSEDSVDCTEEHGGAENGLDFANWAIHISVKFRENEPLSLLDSHRQSGGERAVSTIFYLMALQSLSRAPFRVVDEINQGMDPRNERMVHGRMVDIATNGGGSQYFLITPKLLSGLKYKEGMTVHCIVSGENVPAEESTYENEERKRVPAPKIDFRHFARRAREMNKAADFTGGDNGRRTDSGVGLRSSFGSVEVGA